MHTCRRALFVALVVTATASCSSGDDANTPPTDEPDASTDGDAGADPDANPGSPDAAVPVSCNSTASAFVPTSAMEPASFISRLAISPCGDVVYASAASGTQASLATNIFRSDGTLINVSPGQVGPGSADGARIMFNVYKPGPGVGDDVYDFTLADVDGRPLATLLDQTTAEFTDANYAVVFRNDEATVTVTVLDEAGAQRWQRAFELDTYTRMRLLAGNRIAAVFPGSVEVIDVATGTVLRTIALATTTVGRAFEPSPDGNRAVFLRCDSSQPAIANVAMVAFDTGTVLSMDQFATSDTLGDPVGHRAWTPNGQRVAIACGEAVLGYDRAGTRLFMHAINAGATEHSYLWGITPANDRVVIMRREPVYDYIRFLDFAGTEIADIDTRGQSDSELVGLWIPELSPDGNYVSFEVDHAFEDLLVWNVQDATDKLQLTGRDVYVDYEWMPDGRIRASNTPGPNSLFTVTGIETVEPAGLSHYSRNGTPAVGWNIDPQTLGPTDDGTFRLWNGSTYAVIATPQTYSLR